MTPDGVKRKQYVSVNGGILVQDLDDSTVKLTPEMCVTKAKPDEAQMVDMEFAWKIVKHVKSNAIVVVKDGATLGVGAGQMNRVGSANIALNQAAESLKAAGKDIHNEKVVLASDGFFPFGDSVASAAEYGVAAIVQPGGSVRDQESIDEADKNGIPMLFTGMRHFKH